MTAAALDEVYVDSTKLHALDPDTLATYQTYQDARLGPSPLAEGATAGPRGRRPRPARCALTGRSAAGACGQ